MFTASQLVAHAVGDYLLQSDWMAKEKTKQSLPAVIHAATYTAPFLFFRPSVKQLSLIAGSHYLIDRYRLARHVCWAKNQISPAPRREMTATGYPRETPDWMAVWLLIIADNILHVLINGLSLRK